MAFIKAKSEHSEVSYLTKENLTGLFTELWHYFM